MRIERAGGTLSGSSPSRDSGFARVACALDRTSHASAPDMAEAAVNGALREAFAGCSRAGPAVEPTRAMSSICSCVRLWSLRNSPKPLTAPHGGIRRDRTAVFDLVGPRLHVRVGHQRERLPPGPMARGAPVVDESRDLPVPGDRRRADPMRRRTAPRPLQRPTRRNALAIARSSMDIVRQRMHAGHSDAVARSAALRRVRVGAVRSVGPADAALPRPEAIGRRARSIQDPSSSSVRWIPMCVAQGGRVPALRDDARRRRPGSGGVPSRSRRACRGRRRPASPRRCSSWSAIPGRIVRSQLQHRPRKALSRVRRERGS